MNTNKFSLGVFVIRLLLVLYATSIAFAALKMVAYPDASWWFVGAPAILATIILFLWLTAWFAMCMILTFVLAAVAAFLYGEYGLLPKSAKKPTEEANNGRSV